MVPYPYKPSIHRILKTGQLVDWTKRAFPTFDLIVVGNAENGRWSIAEQRKSSDGTWLEDIVSFPGPEAFTKEHAERARYILCGPAVSVRDVLSGVERSNTNRLVEMQHESRRARAFSAEKSGTGDPFGVPCR